MLTACGDRCASPARRPQCSTRQSAVVSALSAQRAECVPSRCPGGTSRSVSSCESRNLVGAAPRQNRSDNGSESQRELSCARDALSRPLQGCLQVSRSVRFLAMEEAFAARSFCVKEGACAQLLNTIVRQQIAS
eukprot:IDg18678t1